MALIYYPQANYSRSKYKYQDCYIYVDRYLTVKYWLPLLELFVFLPTALAGKLILNQGHR